MVTLFFTAVLIVSLFAIAVYFWQRPANKSENIELPPLPTPTSLFSSPTPTLPSSSDNYQLPSLLVRAKAGDLNVLIESRNDDTYLQLLRPIVLAASSTNTIHKLAAFITENDLPTDRSLVDAVTASWVIAPDRQPTTQLLHLAALANDAELYERTISHVLRVKREGKLLNISNTELLSLITSEYWLLSSNARSSGAGFILKRTLSSARRELEGTT